MSRLVAAPRSDPSRHWLADHPCTTWRANSTSPIESQASAAISDKRLPSSPRCESTAHRERAITSSAVRRQSSRENGRAALIKAPAPHSAVTARARRAGPFSQLSNFGKTLQRNPAARVAGASTSPIPAVASSLKAARVVAVAAAELFPPKRCGTLPSGFCCDNNRGRQVATSSNCPKSNNVGSTPAVNRGQAAFPTPPTRPLCLVNQATAFSAVSWPASCRMRHARSRRIAADAIRWRHGHLRYARSSMSRSSPFIAVSVFAGLITATLSTSAGRPPIALPRPGEKMWSKVAAALPRNLAQIDVFEVKRVAVVL